MCVFVEIYIVEGKTGNNPRIARYNALFKARDNQAKIDRYGILYGLSPQEIVFLYITASYLVEGTLIHEIGTTSPHKTLAIKN